MITSVALVWGGVAIGTLLTIIIIDRLCYVVPKSRIPKDIKKLVKEGKGEILLVGLFQEIDKPSKTPTKLKVIKGDQE